MDPYGDEEVVTPEQLYRFRSQERRGGGRFRIFAGLFLAALSLAAIGAGIFSWVVLRGGQRRVPSGEVADRFVNYIVIGEAADPRDPSDATCGFAHAYDLLDVSQQELRSFASFCDDFVALCEIHGPLQSSRYRPERRTRRGEHCYELLFGVPGVPHSELAVVLFDVRLLRTETGWRVRDYGLRTADAQDR